MTMIGPRAGERPGYAAHPTAPPISNSYGARNEPALAIIAWLLALALVYINLIPFEYRAVPFGQAVENFRHLTWQHIIVNDRARWFSNVMQFLPFGFFACGALGRRNLMVGIILAALLGTALAAGLEFAQIWVPPRTVALDDIVAEMLGAGIGIIAWASVGPQSIRTVHVALSGGPKAVLAGFYIYLAVYTFVFLHPFDFLMTPGEIGARLSDPHAIVWIPQLGGRGMANLLLKVLLMVPFGAAVKLVWRRGPAFAVLGAVALSYLIEIIHLFEQSAVVNPSNIVAAAAGALLGHWLLHPLHVSELRLTAFLRRAAWIALPFYLLALMIARNWRYGAASWGDLAAVMGSLHWIPLYYAYYAPSNQNAFASALGIGASFAPAGMLLWAIRLTPGAPAGSGKSLLPAAVTAALLCAFIEAGRLFTTGLRPDPTNLLIAAVAAAVAQRGCEWVARVLPDLLRRESAAR